MMERNQGKKNLESQKGNLRQEILELRLPKVYNRTRKNSEKLVGGVGLASHSKSLRTYKIFNWLIFYFPLSISSIFSYVYLYNHI